MRSPASIALTLVDGVRHAVRKQRLILPTRRLQVDASRTAAMRLLTTVAAGGYLDASVDVMTGRLLTYSCGARSFGYTYLEVAKLPAGGLHLDVEVRAVRAPAAAGACRRGRAAGAVLLLLVTAALAAVSLVQAVAALGAERAEGGRTVRRPALSSSRDSSRVPVARA
jgi:hypothetical protein